MNWHLSRWIKPASRNFNTPMISVVMPVLNSRAKIDRALRSLGDQTFRHFEVVLSDGGSVDGTVEYALQSLARQSIGAVAIVAYGSSIYGAINQAVRLARGEWIYVMGSDDALYSHTIFEDVTRLLMTSRADVVYGDSWFELNGGFVYGGPFWLNRLATLNICHQSIFYRSTHLARLGMSYDEAIPIYADWKYNLCLLSCSRFQHIPLLISRFSCAGVSSTKNGLEFEEERYRCILTAFGWRTFLMLSPDWLSRCVAQDPSLFNRIGLAVNRLIHKTFRMIFPSHQSLNLRHLVFVGSRPPLNLLPE